MKIKSSLEKKLMTELMNLSNYQQDALKVFVVLHLNACEQFRREKEETFKRLIVERIKFYGRQLGKYESRVDELLKSYSSMIDDVMAEYNRWFCVVVGELQDTWNNQLIAISNCKISIEQEKVRKQLAATSKRQNYEIVIQECWRQLEACSIEMDQKLNEIFYDNDKALSSEKVNIFHKFMNIFTGKSKVENFVFNSLKTELERQKKVVEETKISLQEEIVHNVAIIKDAQMQTQRIFKEIMEDTV